MEYIESISFTPKIMKYFFAQFMFFTDKKYQNVKKSNNFFRLSRAVAAAAAVDRNLCPTYSLDHKT
jgi:hypothetical protein